MPKLSKRSVSPVPVEASTVSQVTQQLKQLPEKHRDTFTLKQAIAMLSQPILAALDKGYSYEELAEVLAGEGIAIAPTSLRHYLALQRHPEKPQPEATRTRKPAPAKPALTTDKLIRSLKMDLIPQEDVDEVIAFLLDGQVSEPPQAQTSRRAAQPGTTKPAKPTKTTKTTKTTKPARRS